MKISLNGKGFELDKELNLVEFVKLRNLEPERIVIEHNYQIVKREDWSKVTLKENDNLEVLRFVGGG